MICDHFILKSSLVKYHVNSSSQCSLICCKGAWEKLRNIKKNSASWSYFVLLRYKLSSSQVVDSTTGVNEMFDDTSVEKE